MPAPLPPGFRVALDPATRRIDDGLVLVGGAPLRMLRLTPAGAAVVDDFARGEPIPPSDGAQRLARRLLDSGMAHPRPPAATLGPDDVTVVIPIKNSPIKNSPIKNSPIKNSRLKSTPQARHRIVVDDGSDPPIPGAVRHETSRGPGAARNTGWRLARTRLVAFVDADVDLPSDWLDGLLPHFEDPQVAAVAPRIVTYGEPGPRTAYEQARSPLDRGPAESLVRPRARVPFVPTAVLIIRREVLQELDGFDESMRFGEDVDLVWRLARAQHTTRYEPAVLARHPVRDTTTGWLRQRFDYGTSAAPLARRHGSAVAPLTVSAWSAGAWALTALGWPGAGTALAAATTALLEPRLHNLQHPWRESISLAGRGHLYAGSQVADAVRRAWWPIAVAAAIPSRRVRRSVGLAFAGALTQEWFSTKPARPALSPLTWWALRVADDVAYGAGVWAGCVRERDWNALVPDLSSWPGRRPAVEPAITAQPQPL